MIYVGMLNSYSDVGFPYKNRIKMSYEERLSTNKSYRDVEDCGKALLFELWIDTCLGLYIIQYLVLQ